MPGVFDLLVSESAGYYVAPPLVFELRRVRSVDLLAVGQAELAGAADVFAEFDAAAKARRGAGGQADGDEKAAAALAKLAGKPDALRALAARVDAHFSAGVCGVGGAREGVDAGAYRVDQRAEIESPDAPILPVRWVADYADELPDAAPMRVALQRIAEEVRGTVVRAVGELGGAREAARPFRRQPRRAANGARG
jgi:hypothetical protein